MLYRCLKMGALGCPIYWTHSLSNKLCLLFFPQVCTHKKYLKHSENIYSLLSVKVMLHHDCWKLEDKHLRANSSFSGNFVWWWAFSTLCPKLNISRLRCFHCTQIPHSPSTLKQLSIPAHTMKFNFSFILHSKTNFCNCKRTLMYIANKWLTK